MAVPRVACTAGRDTCYERKDGVKDKVESAISTNSDAILLRAARALAAYEGKHTVEPGHLRRMAPSALTHRLRRDPLDEAGSTVRIQRMVSEQFGPPLAAAE